MQVQEPLRALCEAAIFHLGRGQIERTKPRRVVERDLRIIA
jgi:hypothetical protein